MTRRWVHTFSEREIRDLRAEGAARDAGKHSFYHPHDVKPSERSENTLAHLAACEALSRILEVDRVRSVSIEGGPGYDMIFREHKIRIRTVQDFRNRLFVLGGELRDNTDTDPPDILVRAIVTLAKDRTVYFGGWMHRTDFLAVATEQDFLTSRLKAWVVENYHLSPMDTFDNEIFGIVGRG